jgi:tight adherence protein C
MTAGAVAGLGVGLGLWLVLTRLVALGPPGLADRVSLHLRRPAVDGPLLGAGAVSATVEGLLRPYVQKAATRLERVLGGGSSVQRRLQRAGSRLTLQDFRMQQVVWGAVAATAAMLMSVALVAAGSARSPGLLLVFSLGMGVGGVIARDQVLSREIRSRQARILSELPTVADLLAISVAAGETPTGALERTARVAKGELGAELACVLADVRSGRSLVASLDAMSTRLTVPAMSRFTEGIAVAVERGTPLADVLRSQAADAREVHKRTLMEIGGRKEILMLVPVVFLVLPVTILFALFPGLVHFDVVAP